MCWRTRVQSAQRVCGPWQMWAGIVGTYLQFRHVVPLMMQPRFARGNGRERVGNHVVFEAGLFERAALAMYVDDCGTHNAS